MRCPVFIARLIAWLFAVCCPFAAAVPASAPATRPVSFRRDVGPILLNQCQGCHGPEKSKGAYRLDTFEKLMTTGESKSPPITRGDPTHSELFKLITSDDEDDRMPKEAEALPAAQIALLKKWIEEGAQFDGPDVKTSLVSLVVQEHPSPPEVYRQPLAATAVAFSPDGKVLAVAGYHEVTLWDPGDGRLVGRIKKLAERTYGLAWSPDGKTLAVAGGTPGMLGEVRLCDPIAHKPGKLLERIPDVMLTVRYSPDGTRVAAGGADNAVRLFDASTGKRQLLIEQHADWVTDLAFSPDGSMLVTASRDKSSRVFDARTGSMRNAFLLHEEPVFGVAWSADGSTVYSAGRDRKIRAWAATDAKPGALIGIPEADSVRLEVNGGMLFVVCADGALRQYLVEKKELVRTYPPTSDTAYTLSLDPANHRIAVGGHSGIVHLFDIKTGDLLASFIAAPGLRLPASP